jgi:hypothetical protein
VLCPKKPFYFGTDCTSHVLGSAWEMLAMNLDSPLSHSWLLITDLFWYQITSSCEVMRGLQLEQEPWHHT